MRFIVFSVVLLTTLVGAIAADYGAGFIAYVRGDYAAALIEWQPLADQGHANAQRNLGVMYFEGRGVEQDLAIAALWYQEAAAQGHTSAQYSLGTMYEKGQGVPRDTDLAIKWLRRAADQGHPVAAKRLQALSAAPATPANVKRPAPARSTPAPVAGVPRLKPTPPPRLGDDVQISNLPPKPDSLEAPAILASVGPAGSQRARLNSAWQAYTAGDAAQALQIWQDAAALGSAEARYNIAAFYAGGRGITQDLAAAAEWLLPLAGSGDAAAQFQLATLAQLDGREEDFVLWVRRAADLGNPWAQAGIGVQHYEGRGRERDISLAFQWYRRAAANHALAGQRYILDLLATAPSSGPARRPWPGSLWLKRWLDPDAAALASALAAYADADYGVALTELGALADQNIPEALAALAVMLEEGLGLTADPDGAVALFRHAADLGNADAQNRLGLFYAHALERDYATAATWFEAAAGQGHPQAAYNLGVLSLGGTVDDPQGAAEYFGRAAAAGIALAQYDLALMYAKGEGVPLDLTLARQWLTAAAGNGIPEAQFAVGMAFVTTQADFALAHKWLAAASANAAAALRVRQPSVTP
ncbi:MAG: hypothetical protein ACTSX7_12695 [Alphaproteobacteria bacterium]